MKDMQHNSKTQNADTCFELLAQPQIIDRFHVVYGTFLLFGIVILLPWNIFINSTDVNYTRFYFVNFKLNTTESYNAGYREKFTFITSVVGQSTNVIMNVVNIFLSKHGGGGVPKKRIPAMIFLSALVMTLQLVLACIDTSNWPFVFFITCIGSVFVLFVAIGIMQSCVFYLASILPARYTNCVILGTNIAGIFTSILNIVAKATTPDLKMAAIVYFGAALATLLLAGVGYFILSRTKFYQLHEQATTTLNRTHDEDDSNLIVFKQIWPLLFCIWLNFFSTLAIFPVYLLKIEPTDRTFLFFFNKSWFHDIVTFLTFNIAVTIGTLIPVVLPILNIKQGLLKLVGARAFTVFIVFALCNYEPTMRHLPVLINNDWVYWIICTIFPLSFGWLTSLLMTSVSTRVKSQQRGPAAMMSSLSLVIGVMMGLNFSIIYEHMVLL